MTSDIEEQFFKVFGIESKYIEGENLMEYSYGKLEYPEITDHKLLKMICLIADICNYSGDVFDIEQNSISELKDFILYFLINYMKTEHTDTFYKNDEVKMCIQQIFKEEETTIDGIDCVFFKQLKHLQKENKELHTKLGNIEILLANAESDLKFEENRTNTLEQENEKLKETNELKNNLLADLGCPTIATAKRLQLTLKEKINKLEQENNKLKDSLSDAEAVMLTYKIEKEKYQQALEEMRELAEVNSLSTCWTILSNCNDCHNNNECGEQSPIAKLKFIKDKVNEVLK